MSKDLGTSPKHSDKYKKKITLKFISDSRESIKAGYKVFYSSWW